jgi:hypothetical protein
MQYVARHSVGKSKRHRQLNMLRLAPTASCHRVEHSIREFCDRAKASFERCSTFDMTRQFLLDHVQRIVYLRSKVTILGSVPVKRSPSEAPVPLPFRIDGELDRKAIRAKPQKMLPDDGRWKKLQQIASEEVSHTVKEVTLA